MEAGCNVRPRVLVADDQPAILEALNLLLRSAGFDSDRTTGANGLVDALQQRRYDLVLMDMNYSSGTTTGDEGLQLLTRIGEIDEDVPVVVMTGWSSVELAVATLRAHAADFVQKPWDNHTLLTVVRREIEKGRNRRAERHAELQEVEEARGIQNLLLPTTVAAIPGWDVAAAWRPARAVTGDYFDAIRLGATEMAVCIGDVAGKGLPAALLMSSVQAAVRALASEHREPHDLCGRLNRLICDSTADDRYITFFYGVLDTTARTLTYTNAGHNPPFAIRRDRSFQRLCEGGVPLGMFEHAAFESSVISVGDGDRVVLFTDGVIEARTPSHREFGEDGLVAAFDACEHLGAAELKDRIVHALTSTCGAGLTDDATIVVVAST